MVLCCDSFDASFELQPWQNGIQLLSIKSGSFCYCPQCGLHTFHSSPCDRCVCVTSIELPIFRALTIESNSMGKLKMSKTFEHITLFRNACKSETVDFSLFKRVFQFWVFVCVSDGHCPFVCVFMKRWATHFNLSIPLWINRFQLWWLISNTLWMSCELKIRTCAWMLK